MPLSKGLSHPRRRQSDSRSARLVPLLARACKTLRPAHSRRARRVYPQLRKELPTANRDAMCQKRLSPLGGEDQVWPACKADQPRRQKSQVRGRQPIVRHRYAAPGNAGIVLASQGGAPAVPSPADAGTLGGATTTTPAEIEPSAANDNSPTRGTPRHRHAIPASHVASSHVQQKTPSADRSHRRILIAKHGRLVVAGQLAAIPT